MVFDNNVYENGTETNKNDGDQEDNVAEMTDEELVEHIQELDNVEQVPTNACNRYEVCGNTTTGSDTCGECWHDVLEQLDFPAHDGYCPECDHRYWKFIPAGRVCILRCKECGHKEEQVIEYTGEDDLDPVEQAVRDARK